MKSRCFFLWLLLLAPPAVWATGETARLVLLHAGMGLTGQGSNARLELKLAAPLGFTAADPGSSLIQLFDGPLAPATDRAGVITRQRVERILLGLDLPVEPLAVDFAGNRDGRIDVADLVLMTNKQLP